MAKKVNLLIFNRTVQADDFKAVIGLQNTALVFDKYSIRGLRAHEVLVWAMAELEDPKKREAVAFCKQLGFTVIYISDWR